MMFGSARAIPLFQLCRPYPLGRGIAGCPVVGGRSLRASSGPEPPPVLQPSPHRRIPRHRRLFLPTCQRRPDRSCRSSSRPAAASPPAPVAPAMPQETVEADVSTRSVAITSAFRGTEIVVFGTVNHSRQESAESGLYDIVVVVEGASAPLVARRRATSPAYG